MAGASNPDLFDFIESLEREEKYSTTNAVVAPKNTNIDDTISDSSSIISNRDSQTVVVWQDISMALNNWTQRILDVESRCNKDRYISTNNRRVVEEATIERVSRSKRLMRTTTYCRFVDEFIASNIVLYYWLYHGLLYTRPYMSHFRGPF